MAKESKSNTTLNQYLREKRLYCYYELKVAKDDNFYFKNIEVNQAEGLPAMEKEGLVWKLSDEDRRKKPCDGFCTPPLPSYLVIRFGNTFYMIRFFIIDSMIKEGEVKITLKQAINRASRVIHT